MNIPTPYWIYLSNGRSAKNLNIEELAAYLQTQLPQFCISVRPNVTEYYLAQLLQEQTEAELDKLAPQITSCRVRNLMEPPIEPLYGAISYEKRRLQGKSKAVGVLYDGFGLSAVFFRLIENGDGCEKGRG